MKHQKLTIALLLISYSTNIFCMETTEQQVSGPEAKTMTQDIVAQQETTHRCIRCCHTNEHGAYYFDVNLCCPRLVYEWGELTNPEYLRAFEKEYCCNKERCCYCGPKGYNCGAACCDFEN